MEFLTLNYGVKMPFIGLGTSLKYQNASPKEEDVINFEKAIDEALKIGYRHFDTAFFYGTEISLGNVLKKWIDKGKVQRSDLFITTKLPCNGNHPDKVEYFLNLSLKNLQMDFVDLYIIHQPVGTIYHSDRNFTPLKPDGSFDLVSRTNIEGIWKVMEKCFKSGLARSIGISNFNAQQIERVLKVAEIQPANLQVELNLYFQQKELRKFCQQKNISVVAFSPLGAPGVEDFHKKVHDNKPPALFEDPTVVTLAKNYSKTPAQILLRFLTQLNVVPIPKSITISRLKSNFEIFNFKIDDDDMKTLEALDRGESGRFFTLKGLKGFSEHPDYPF